MSLTFSLASPPVTPDQLQRIEEAMVGLLGSVGLEVGNEWLSARLAERGYRADSAGRVRIPAPDVRRFLDATRQRNGRAFALDAAPPRPVASASEVTVDPSWYALYFHDAATGAVAPLTVERHIEALRLVEALRPEGVRSTWVGQPGDVPGPLRPVLQYWLAGTCLAQPRIDHLLQTAESLPFELEMAEVLGTPIRAPSVFCQSPLKVTGSSIDCLVSERRRFTGINVWNMPDAGNTAPIHLGDALAFSAAEVVGTALLLQAALEIPANFGAGLFPSDMRSLLQMPGSPEAWMLKLAAGEVNAFLHGRAWAPGSGNLHISACLPGAQAAAEKSAIVIPGVLLGTRHFSGAGVLSSDEIFSPEQLLWDLEVRDHACRLAAGWDAVCDVERAVAEALESVRGGSYIAMDSTAEWHRKRYWTPRLFHRGSVGTWQAAGRPDPREKIHARLRELKAASPYVAPDDRARELDRVLAAAQRALGTEYKSPTLLGR